VNTGSLCVLERLEMEKSSQEFIDELYAKYPDKWVAHRDDGEVVASADDIEQLFEKLEQLGMDGPEVIVGFFEDPARIYIYAT
jgi:hypothetical protein